MHVNVTYRPTPQSAAEQVCREFADQFDSPNVERAIRLAELRTVTWEQLETLFARTLASALTEVELDSNRLVEQVRDVLSRHPEKVLHRTLP